MSNKEKILKLQKLLDKSDFFKSSKYKNLVFEKGEMFIVKYENTFHENPYLVPASDEDFTNLLRNKLEADYVEYMLFVEHINKRKQILENLYTN